MVRALFVYLSIAVTSGCTHLESFDSLCVIDSKNKRCWVDEETDEGFTFKEIDGRFSMSEEALKQIFRKLDMCYE